MNTKKNHGLPSTICVTLLITQIAKLVNQQHKKRKPENIIIFIIDYKNQMSKAKLRATKNYVFFHCLVSAKSQISEYNVKTKRNET
jgi:hypothetical protein